MQGGTGSPPSTTFRVQVIGAAKGRAEPGILLVDQYGGKRGRDFWVLEDQEPLQVGRIYVLAVTGTGAEPRTLIAGPASVTPTVEGHIASELAVWKARVAKNRQPDVPR